MERILRSEYKSPIRMNIEITGPCRGYCDIPFERTDDAWKIINRETVESLLDQGIRNEVMMYSMLFADHRDLFNDDVVRLIGQVHEKTGEIGLLKSLNFPIKAPFLSEDIAAFKEQLRKIVADYLIDEIYFFIQHQILMDHSASIAGFMEELAVNHATQIKLYTDMPSRAEDIKTVYLPILNNIIKTTKIWKSFSVGLVLIDHTVFNQDILSCLNDIYEESEFTIFFQPAINSCIVEKLKQRGDVHLTQGFCPSFNSIISFSVDGTLIPCLKYRNTKLNIQGTVWDSWAKIGNFLEEVKECPGCPLYQKKCNGMCQTHTSVLALYNL